MTSTAATSLTTADETRPLITPRGWVWIGVLASSFVLLHHNILYRSVLISFDDPNWSHALLVPVISLYYLFQQRNRLMRLSSRVCWWGLPIMLFGMIGYAFSIYPGQNDMFQGYSMLISLFGLILFVLGPRMMTILWFPIFYLGFGIKVSQKLWELIALKLQTIASISSTLLLNIIGVFCDLEATVRGNTIDMFHHGMRLEPPMNVAEACSGLRMLMAFLALGVAMAFLMPRTWWQRAVMVLMTLPVAVAVNVGRVTTLGLLHVYAPDYATGDFHIFVGMLMLIPAAGLFWLLGWMMERVIIYEPGETSNRDAVKRIQPAAFTPTEADAKIISKGAIFGGSLTFFACLIYVLLSAAARPDMAVEKVGGAESLIQVASMTGVGIILVLMWVGAQSAWRRLIPTDNRTSAGQKRGVALAIGIGFLTTAIIGQGAILKVNQVVMFKKEVPLRKSLTQLGHPTGNWQFVRQDEPLKKDLEDELGTKLYVNRTYTDTAWIGSPQGSAADLHVAYYTGKVDTVPHVPQQCFKASGLEQVAGGSARITLHGEGYQADPDIQGGYLYPVQESSFGSQVRLPSLDIPVTYFTFANPEQNNHFLNVVYFFVANGKFLPSPHAVRAHGFDFRDKYSYYCKVQVTVWIEDKDLAVEHISSFLSEMMPEIMSCLPDWVDVTEGRWPANQTAVGAVVGE